MTEIVRRDNNIKYYEDGLLHKEDGPAIEFGNGDKEWYFKGKLHRHNGPAKDYKFGFKAYYIHGRLHREDGPAVLYPTGEVEWWLDGRKFISEEEWQKSKDNLIVINNDSMLVTKPEFVVIPGFFILQEGEEVIANLNVYIKAEEIPERFSELIINILLQNKKILRIPIFTVTQIPEKPKNKTLWQKIKDMYVKI